MKQNYLPIRGNPEDPFIWHIEQHLVPERMTGKWVAASFTLRQGAPRDDGTLQNLLRIEVKKCIAEYMKRLNKETAGPAYRRYGKRLSVIPTIERDINGRLHVHMLLEWPDRMTLVEFKALAVPMWASFRWAMQEHDFRSLPSFDDVKAWTQYILKDARDNPHVLDIDDMYLPWERDQDANVQNKDSNKKALPPIRTPKLPSTYLMSDFEPVT